jgi:dUTP pyrophosphatase
MLTIKFKKLKENAILPRYAYLGDAGMDVFSAEGYTLQPGEWHGFSTGIASELPDGFFARLAPKSGLAVKQGIDTFAGVIDNTYRGEWVVVLVNHGKSPVGIKAGDKIAQVILQRFEPFLGTEVNELSKTNREANGFGSTGK